MIVTLHNTSKIVDFNGIPTRVWEGHTDSGIKVHAYITRISIDANEPRTEQFENELQWVHAPSPEVNAIPLRLII